MLDRLNVNLLWNKFESITDVIQGTFDVFLSPETKIDKGFLNILKIQELTRGMDYALCEREPPVQKFNYINW